MNFSAPPRKRSRWQRAWSVWLDLPIPARMGALLIAFVALAWLSGCTTPEKTAVSPERAAQCDAAGGCVYVSRADVDAMIQLAWAMGAEQAAHEAAEGLDSHGCKRGST